MIWGNWEKYPPIYWLEWWDKMKLVTALMTPGVLYKSQEEEKHLKLIVQRLLKQKCFFHSAQYTLKINKTEPLYSFTLLTTVSWIELKAFGSQI